jgi:putative membrane protein
MARSSGIRLSGRWGSVREHVRPAERVGTEPDYRFTLANERTFLAYVRTALGLDAAGLAVAQFFDRSVADVRVTLAVAAIVLAIAVIALGYLRWWEVERAMRLGVPLPPIRLPLVLAAGMVLLSAIAITLVATQ